MKTIPLITFFFAIVIFNNCGQAKMNSADEQTLKILKEFYTLYITENSKMPPDIKRIEAIKKKYCTIRLLNKIKKEELDYDPIINAQDCDIKWLETLSIIKDDQKPNMFIVSYTDNFSKKKNIIKLTVKKEQEGLKIDAIL